MKKRITHCLPAILLLFFCLPGSTWGARVSYDSYSLLVDGERRIILSGEFHYWRLPSRDLWPEILRRIRAAGYNAVRVYFPWSVHSPGPGVYDFQGIRDVSALLEECRRQDLYVLAAMGPYVCAETDAGGLPAWLFQYPLKLRCLEGTLLPRGVYDPAYVQGWTREWFSRILPILAAHQVTRDPEGPVLLVQVENEYPEALLSSGPVQIPPRMGNRQYVEELVEMTREYGIDVPVSHNDVSFLNLSYPGSWNGIVDLYSIDLYPFTASGQAGGGPSWDTGNAFRPLLDRTETLVRGLGGQAAETPLFMAEYQGGWYDGWGGEGYDARYDALGPAYFNILDKSLLAQGFTIINRYMFYGGTNWGYLPNPEVYTSYDYGAPLREWGVMSGAYAAMKRIGMFLEAFPGLWSATERLEVPEDTSEDPRALYRVRESRFENPDGSHPRLTFLRNGDREGDYSTRVRVPWMGDGHLVPRAPGAAIPVPERSMRILVSNLQLERFLLLYSTFELLTCAGRDDSRKLVVYGREGEQGEMAFHIPDEPRVEYASEAVDWSREKDAGELVLRATVEAEPLFFKFSQPGGHGSLTLLLVSEDLAGRTWRVRDGEREILVIGPYFVPPRVVETGERDTVGLPLWVHSPSPVYLFPGNRKPGNLPETGEEPRQEQEIGLVRFDLTPKEPPALPKLGPWVFTPGAPETEPGFDDGFWRAVPDPDSMSPDLYGFHYGFVWYRGKYAPAPGMQPQALRLDARHCYSVYWNGRFLGSHDSFTTGMFGPGAAGSPDLFSDPVDFSVPQDSVEETNTISVLVENLGHNKGFASFYDIMNPRGILSAEVVGDPETQISWKIQGRSAREGTDPFNASGLHGEREGAYLPGFEDAGWLPVDLPHDWDQDDRVVPGFAGTGWYRTRFRLDLPEGMETPLCLRVRRASSKALIWINGRLMGRTWEAKGPQSRFYLPKGVLNTSGENVLAVCLWRRGDEQGNPEPAVLDMAGLEPYPLDHRVSGGPVAGNPENDAGFSATRHLLTLGTGTPDESVTVTGESGGGCGGCRTADGASLPWGSGLLVLLLTGFLQILRRRMRKEEKG